MKGVSILQCREYFLDGDCITLPLFGITLRMENLHWRYICNRKLQVVVFCYHPTKKGTENGANIVNIYWKHVWNKLKYWNHSLAQGKLILQILRVKWALNHTYGRWPNSVEVICTLVQCTLGCPIFHFFLIELHPCNHACSWVVWVHKKISAL